MGMALEEVPGRDRSRPQEGEQGVTSRDGEWEGRGQGLGGCHEELVSPGHRVPASNAWTGAGTTGGGDRCRALPLACPLKDDFMGTLRDLY